MSAPPKPWERPRVQTQPPTQPISTMSAAPATPAPAITANQTNPNLNPALMPNASNNQISGNITTANGATLNALGNNTYARRPMMSSSPYSSMYRPGMYSSYGGMGMGMGYGGYGGMGMGMGGYGGYGGMGGYGMGMGAYGEPPSKGMIAIERFSILVSSLCFTAETIENSMHSMGVFWEALIRIKSWGSAGVKTVLIYLRNKFNALVQHLLYFIGRGDEPEEDLSIVKVLLNLAAVYICLQLGRFLWSEMTKAPIEEATSYNYL
ncbi:unnamed protein product [Blepharisma stoltei]|uniref:Peroxin-13 n=1 Tax=Blepharisma stoltei TaxID=1481888 RepID=A0AAU9IDG3_9CILI|nr:unnamed protein product [Blepharisma stoltei]